jgi:hypothetical protein
MVQAVQANLACIDGSYSMNKNTFQPGKALQHCIAQRYGCFTNAPTTAASACAPASNFGFFARGWLHAHCAATQYHDGDYNKVTSVDFDIVMCPLNTVKSQYN